MSITLPKIDPIDFLVTRKFPDAVAITTAYNRVPVGGIPSGLRSATVNEEWRNTVKKKFDEISAYRDALQAKSPQEIDALFNKAQAEAAEERRIKERKGRASAFFQSARC